MRAAEDLWQSSAFCVGPKVFTPASSRGLEYSNATTRKSSAEKPEPPLAIGRTFGARAQLASIATAARTSSFFMGGTNEKRPLSGGRRGVPETKKAGTGADFQRSW